MTTDNPKIVTRFAPSPTGFLHAGNYRTALFSYLYTKKHNGKFILRIEDTDKARSKKEYEDNIIESLHWLNLKYDEFYRQSDRTEIYRKYLDKLISENKAFISKEVVKKEGDRAEVIRFRNPNKKVMFHDLIRGNIEFDTTELGDFVIARSLEEPIFHLVVTVDDFEMGVTHVVRGEDHISNTPRQILIQEAIGAPIPEYAHLPIVLAPDKSKLSKRKGARAISEYRDLGFLPEAMLNYMALLGWNPGTEKEIFTLNELIQEFDLSKVQKSGAIFNEEKLKWVNKEHLKIIPGSSEMIADEIQKHLPNTSETILRKITPIVLERVNLLTEIKAMIDAGELSYFVEAPTYEPSALVWKKDTSENAKIHLTKAISILESIAETDFSADHVKSQIWPYAEAVGRGNILWPMRYALSGRDKSPDPFVLADILGKTETLQRLHNAYNALS